MKQFILKSSLALALIAIGIQSCEKLSPPSPENVEINSTSAVSEREGGLGSASQDLQQVTKQNGLLRYSDAAHF